MKNMQTVMLQEFVVCPSRENHKATTTVQLKEIAFPFSMSLFYRKIMKELPRGRKEFMKKL